MTRKSYFTITALFCILGAIFFSGCFSRVTGIGPIETHSRNIPSFSELVLNIPANITLVISDSTACVLSAQNNIAEIIETKIKGNKLVIDSKKNYRTDKPVEIILSVSEIEYLEINGSGNIHSVNSIKGGKLKLIVDGSGTMILTLNVEELSTSLNGSGEISIAGNAASHTAELNGSGNLKCYNLNTDKYRISISGSGNAEISANESLNASLNGSGSIRYHGLPKVKSEINGSGDISKSN